MKSISKLNCPAAVLLTTIALSASATNANQVARVINPVTITAECCVTVGSTVHLTEPATVVPVIVTWSSDWILFDTVQFGLSLNGRPCTFYGPSVGNLFASGSASSFISGTLQWVIFPSDGLKKGPNSFTVCGGGVGKAVTMTIGSNTLTVQSSN